MDDLFDAVPIPRLVLRLGLPAMLAQAFNILYSVVDRIFVGHLPGSGSLALAGLGVCAPALTAVTAFASLVGIGGAAVLSLSMGGRDHRTARQAMSTSLVLLAGLSVVLTVVLLAAARPLLYLLGCSDAIWPYASRYFRLYVLGTPAALIGSGMNAFLLAQGQARRGMLSVTIGALLNTALDPLFLFVLDLGVAGAALATVLAQCYVMGYVLRQLRRPELPYPLRPARPSGPVARRILAIGCLPFFIVLLDNLLIILLDASLQRWGGPGLGDRLLSCAAVVQSFMLLAYCPAQGITSGCATLYGYHFGAGHYEKVVQVFRWVLIVCLVYLSALCLFSQTAPERFARLFCQDEALVPLAAACIRRYAAGLPGVAVQYALVDGLTAMGRTRSALPISFFRKGLYVLLVLVLPLLRPVEDLFWCAALSDLIGASVTAVVFLCVVRPRLAREMDRA